MKTKLKGMIILCIMLSVITPSLYSQNYGVQKLKLNLNVLIASATEPDGIMTVPENYPERLGDPKLFGLMANHVPIGEEYKNLPIDQVLRISKNFVSVLIIELRGTSIGNSKNRFTVGWVDKNSNVFDFYGEPLFISKPKAGNYYIAIHLPNTFPLMTPVRLSVSGGANQIITWNFTTGPDKCYGGDMLPIPGTTKWGAIAGEYLSDGIIDVSDISEVYNNLGNTGWYRVDFNNDNVVDAKDLSYITPLENRISNILYENMEIQIASEEKLSNFPNPFNPTTAINFTVPKTGLVKLKVYDMIGKEISTLVNEVRTAGNYSVNFDASGLSSGTYFYKLESGGEINIKKMMLIK